MSHIEDDTLRALYRNQLTGAEARAVLDHLHQCEECRRRAVIVTDSAQRMKDVLEIWKQEDDQESVPRRLPFAKIATAAAAAAAAILLAVLMVRKPVDRPTAVEANRPLQQHSTVRAAEWNDVIQNTLQAGRIDPPQEWLALQSDTERYRDMSATNHGSESITLDPDNAIVESTRPHFTWSAIEGATYVVTISRKLDNIVKSEPLHETSWTSTVDLTRGATYSWQVAAQRGATTTILPAPPSPPSRFTILGQDATRTLDRARAQAPNDHLLLGILYARYGLKEEAIRELEAAKETKLLASVRDWRRQPRDKVF